MDKNCKINKILNFTFLFCFAIFLFYYSYRYIFKYNSTNTSPSYSDTPTSLQLAKYILLALSCLYTLLLLFIKNHKIKITPILLIYLVMLFYDFIITKDSNIIVSISILTIFIIIYFSKAKLNIKSIMKLVDVFIIFSILYESIQILLYIFTGRLPALAYSTGVISDVRFGGPWDDPNGFGVLLSFLIPYVYLTKSGHKRNILITILLFMLILTWSFTAYFCFGIVFIIWLYSLFNNKLNFLGLILFSGIVIIIVFSTPMGQMLIKNKLGSMLDHFNSYNLKDYSIVNFLGIIPKKRVTESGYISILYNGGIFAFGIFIYIAIIGIKGLLNLIKSSNDKESVGLYKAMLIFVIIFLIGMLNLPLNNVFSVCGIYYMFILIGWLNKDDSSLDADFDSLDIE